METAGIVVSGVDSFKKCQIMLRRKASKLDTHGFLISLFERNKNRQCFGIFELNFFVNVPL